MPLTKKLLNTPHQNLISAMTFKTATRTEQRFDENVYPPESAIKPEFIIQVKKAEADIKAGKGKRYKSIDVFIRSLEE